MTCTYQAILMLTPVLFPEIGAGFRLADWDLTVVGCAPGSREPSPTVKGRRYSVPYTSLKLHG
jgi:hypothetical protein